MILSVVSAESQTTLPPEVRKALGLEAGDRLAYYVEDGEVRIGKASTVLADPFLNPFAVFTEWADELDSEAFKSL